MAVKMWCGVKTSSPVKPVNVNKYFIYSHHKAIKRGMSRERLRRVMYIGRLTSLNPQGSPQFQWKNNVSADASRLLRIRY